MLKFSSKFGISSSSEVVSLLSCEHISLRRNAQSSAVLAIGPAWSRLDANAIIPHREILPYVGFIPVIPQTEAGCLIDPPVSVPEAAGTIPAAIAEAEPPELPPGTRFLPHGL